MTTPRQTQTWWQELQDPGVNPKLEQMIALLQQLVDNLAVTQVTNPVTTGTRRSSEGHSLSNPVAPHGLLEVLPGGTVFTLPETLQRFNALVGASAIAGAVPLELTQEVVINPGATNSFVYTVPEGIVSIAMSGAHGYFTRHSADILINGFVNYGLPDEQLITEPNIPATHDFFINRLVDGSHEIKSNLTILFTNQTPWVVTVTIQVTLLQVDQSLWDNMYYPIFRQAVRVWMESLAQDARSIGGQST